MNYPLNESQKKAWLLELISREILEVGSDFDEHSSLHEAGLDSLATMQLLIKIEQAYGVQLPATKLTKENMASVASLAKII
jgi:diaminopimelate decarboxylase